MKSNMSCEVYVHAEGTKPEMSRQAYMLEEGPADMCLGLALQYTPGSSEWPRGTIDLNRLAKSLLKSRVDGWRIAFSIVDRLLASSTCTSDLHLTFIQSSEFFTTPYSAYARRIELLGYCGPHWNSNQFQVTYQSTGFRANGDPVATITVQPAEYQFPVLKHIAGIVSDLPVETKRHCSENLYPLFLVFGELQSFFKVYRFDWCEQSGWKVYYC